MVSPRARFLQLRRCYRVTYANIRSLGRNPSISCICVQKHSSKKWTFFKCIYNQSSFFGRILESPNDLKQNVRLSELNRPSMDTSVLENIRKVQQKQKKQNDKKDNKIIEFKINDFILLEINRQIFGHVRVFEPKFRGRYIV